MRILAIADEPPRRPISEYLSEMPIDLICVLGDLDFYTLIDLQKIRSIPKLGVYGNHCERGYFERLGIRDMHLDRQQVLGLWFGGFEGCPRYKPDSEAIMHTQKDAQDLLAKFPPVDVMLTHAPPLGVNDEPGTASHQGFRALRDYVERGSVRYLLHGHTNPRAPVERFGSTEIRHVKGARIMDIHI